MLEINKKKLFWKIKEIWFADSPFDVKNCDSLVFYNCGKSEEKEGFICEEYSTLVIDTRNKIDDIWQNMDKSSCRYMINSANKRKINIIINEKIDDFIKINKSFRNKKGLLGLKLSSEFIKKFGVLFIAELDGDILGGQLYLKDSNNMRWLVGASNRLSVTKEKAILIGYANRLLVWEAIKYAKYNGIINFDFGGYYKGTEDKEKIGINKFKESFGGKLFVNYICRKNYSKIYEFAFFIKQRLFIK